MSAPPGDHGDPRADAVGRTGPTEVPIVAAPAVPPAVPPPDARIRALIFDMDGLLVDSEPLSEVAMRVFLRRHGRDLEPDLMGALLGRRLPEATAIVAARYGLPGNVAALTEEFDEVRLETIRGNLRAFPGAAELIAFARAAGLRVALATSSRRRHVDLSLAETGLSGRFDAEATGDEVALGKPAPDLFLLAAGRLGVAAADCVVLEDAPTGVAAAAAAGMRCLLVRRPGTPAASFPVAPTATLADLDAAAGWLRGWGVQPGGATPAR